MVDTMVVEGTTEVPQHNRGFVDRIRLVDRDVYILSAHSRGSASSGWDSRKTTTKEWELTVINESRELSSVVGHDFLVVVEIDRDKVPVT
jgi:hypothetical protein